MTFHRLYNLSIPLSGAGTHEKGYQGHGDADWREQVAEGVEAMQKVSRYLLVPPHRPVLKLVHRPLFKIAWSKDDPAMQERTGHLRTRGRSHGIA